MISGEAYSLNKDVTHGCLIFGLKTPFGHTALHMTLMSLAQLRDLIELLLSRARSRPDYTFINMHKRGMDERGKDYSGT